MILGLMLTACGDAPVPIAPIPDAPASVVDQAMASVVRSDLVGASTMVCLARRDAANLPFPISGVFDPLGAMPAYSPARTIAVMQLDASELSIVETRRDASSAQVMVSGILVERFDPAEVEALFRAYASDTGGQVDQALLEETLTNVGHGPVRLLVDEMVNVVVEAGAWRICPDLPVN